MLLDIHRHSRDKGSADKVLRNLFHNETTEIGSTDFCSVGLHPWHIKKQKVEKDIALVREAAGHSKVLAIGEAGIDKAIDTDIEIQRYAFSEQINIAKDFAKPMIIHCVRAYDEIQYFRKESKHQQPWIFHWYNASVEMGFDLIDKGCYLSFGHLLFVERSKAFKTFCEAPVEKIFLETDDANVTIDEVYDKASSVKGINKIRLQEQIMENFYNCFNPDSAFAE